MNFSFFESLSIEEAKDHLNGFITTESSAIEMMRPAAIDANVVMDFSMASLPALLRWVYFNIEVTRGPIPETEPDWIREFHKDGLVEFTEESKYLVLRAAYYLGESFIRTDDQLSWGIGNV